MKLTQTQKKVFCALNAYPEYNDRQIAELLHMRRSTVTLARHFLEKEGLYTMYLFPHFEKIQIPLIGIIYGDYGKLQPVDYAKRMEMRPKELKIPEYVFSFSSDMKGFSMCFAEQLHTLKEPFEAWTALFKSIDSHIPIEQCYFPQEMVKTYRFMQTQNYLSQILHVPAIPQRRKNKKIRILRKKEKEVMLAWMQYPRLTNEELSQKTKLSRATIGSIKKRLIHYELIQHIQIPDWYALGLQLGVLIHLHFHGDSKALQEFQNLPEAAFLVGSSYELVSFCLFKDYDSYQKRLGPLLKSLQQEKVLTHEPREIIFPLAEAKHTLQAFEFLQKVFTK